MSTLALAPPRYRELGGEPTLDELITGAWEGLAAHHPVECPVCGRELAPFYGAQNRRPDERGASSLVDLPAAREPGSRAGHVLKGGRCLDCATTLS